MKVIKTMIWFGAKLVVFVWIIARMFEIYSGIFGLNWDEIIFIVSLAWVRKP